MTDAKTSDSECRSEKFSELTDKDTIEKLIKIGTALSVERNLSELLRMIVTELRAVVAADKATLFLIDKEKNELLFHIPGDESLKEVRLPLNRKSIAGYVAMTNDPLRIADVYELPESTPYKFNKDIDKQTGYRTTSMLTLPMIDHKSETIGVIQLINKTVNNKIIPFDCDDESLLSAIASQAAVSIENARLYSDIEHFFASFLRALASAIEARDPVTKGHSRRVAMYSEAIAKAMKKFSESEIKELIYSAWLHDVGKIGVKEYVLNKKNKLSDDEIEVIHERFQVIKNAILLRNQEEIIKRIKENPTRVDSIEAIINEQKALAENEFSIIDGYYKLIEEKNRPGFVSDDDKRILSEISQKTYMDPGGHLKHYLTRPEMENLIINRGNLTQVERENMDSHVLYTWDILSEIPFTKELKNVPFFASMHHERLDGSGYPFKYSSDKVPIQARILAIADIYDALTAQDRPYKKPIPRGKALDILEEMVDSGQLDREIFITFIKNKIYELEDKGDEFSFLGKIID